MIAMPALLTTKNLNIIQNLAASNGRKWHVFLTHDHVTPIYTPLEVNGLTSLQGSKFSRIVPLNKNGSCGMIVRDDLQVEHKWLAYTYTNIRQIETEINTSCFALA